MYTFKIQNYQIITKSARLFVVSSQFMPSLLFIYQKGQQPRFREVNDLDCIYLILLGKI